MQQKFCNKKPETSSNSLLPYYTIFSPFSQEKIARFRIFRYSFCPLFSPFLPQSVVHFSCLFLSQYHINNIKFFKWKSGGKSSPFAFFPGFSAVFFVFFFFRAFLHFPHFFHTFFPWLFCFFLVWVSKTVVYETKGSKSQ